MTERQWVRDNGDSTFSILVRDGTEHPPAPLAIASYYTAYVATSGSERNPVHTLVVCSVEPHGDVGYAMQSLESVELAVRQTRVVLRKAAADAASS